MVDVLDAKGLMCPMPIVQLAKKIKTMKVGDELDLISDDVGLQGRRARMVRADREPAGGDQGGQRGLHLPHQEAEVNGDSARSPVGTPARQGGCGAAGERARRTPGAR